MVPAAGAAFSDEAATSGKQLPQLAVAVPPPDPDDAGGTNWAGGSEHPDDTSEAGWADEDIPLKRRTETLLGVWVLMALLMAVVANGIIGGEEGVAVVPLTGLL